MSVANFNPEIERELREDQSSPWFDADFGGSGFHELPPCSVPTATDPHPGRFELDPEASEMNELAACTAERHRLRELVPGATVLVQKVIHAFANEEGEHTSVQWHAHVSTSVATGFIFADVATTTLREACDRALCDFAKKALDAVAGASEGRAA